LHQTKRDVSSDIKRERELAHKIRNKDPAAHEKLSLRVQQLRKQHDDLFSDDLLVSNWSAERKHAESSKQWFNDFCNVRQELTKIAQETTEENLDVSEFMNIRDESRPQLQDLDGNKLRNNSWSFAFEVSLACRDFKSFYYQHPCKDMHRNLVAVPCPSQNFIDDLNNGLNDAEKIENQKKYGGETNQKNPSSSQTQKWRLCLCSMMMFGSLASQTFFTISHTDL